MNASNKESILVQLRQEMELTQKEIAEALGVTEQTVRNWEQGKAVPKLTIPQTKTLCRLLQRSIEELPDSFGPKQSADDATHTTSALDDLLN